MADRPRVVSRPVRKLTKGIEVKRRRQRWTRGNAFHAAAQVLAAEVTKIEVSELLHATFLTLKTADGREWLFTSDAKPFVLGDRVRITVDGAFVRDVVAA